MRIVAAGVLVAAACFGQVTWERMLHAEREPQNWLTLFGYHASQRYSALTRDHRRTTSRTCELKWVFQAQFASKSSRPRRWLWTASCTRSRRRTTSWRWMQRPAACIWIVSLHAVAARAAVLRPREPRRGDPRRHAVHGHDRRAPDRRRRQERQARVERRVAESGAGLRASRSRRSS